MYLTAKHLKHVASRHYDRSGVRRDTGRADRGLPTLFIGRPSMPVVAVGAHGHPGAEHPSNALEIEDGGQSLHPCLISAK